MVQITVVVAAGGAQFDAMVDYLALCCRMVSVMVPAATSDVRSDGREPAC